MGTLQQLKTEIEKGINSGIDEAFDPENCLEEFMARYQAECEGGGER